MQKRLEILTFGQFIIIFEKGFSVKESLFFFEGNTFS